MKRSILYLIFLFITPFILSAQNGNWRIVSEMPVPVKGAQAVLKDSMIYVIGGYSDQSYAPTKLIQKYDPVANTWQVLSDTLKLARYGLSAVNYRNSVVMFGGTTENDSSLEIWDYMGETYFYDQQNIFQRQFATAQVYGNYLYIFGGLLPNAEIKIPYLVEYYIPGATVTFSRPSSYANNPNPETDAVQQMSALVQGNIFVIGGALNGILKDIYRFNIAQLEWQKSDAILLEERAAGAAVSLFDESIAVIGGYNESEPALATCEQIIIQDSNVKYQQPLPKLNIARSELTAVVFDTTLFVFGGQDVLGNCVAKVEALHVIPEFTPVEKAASAIPSTLRLFDNYPNPFNQTTIIRFYNDHPQAIVLEIFDITGQKIRTLRHGDAPSGTFRLVWDGKDRQGKDVPTGIYFYRLTSPETSITKRMILLR